MEPALTGVAIAASIYFGRTRTPQENGTVNSLYCECVVGGGANAFVSALLNPMDRIKTRMQVEINPNGKIAGSLSRSVNTIIAEGGVAALWIPGMTATMVREETTTVFMITFPMQSSSHQPNTGERNVQLFNPNWLVCTGARFNNQSHW